jgi:hypothetical protein
MNKYYVQSGELKTVIMAKSQFDACLRSLNRYFDTDIMISASFTVSERGFVLDREPFWIDTTENIYSSEEVMSEYIKWVD